MWNVKLCCALVLLCAEFVWPRNLKFFLTGLFLLLVDALYKRGITFLVVLMRFDVVRRTVCCEETLRKDVFDILEKISNNPMMRHASKFAGWLPSFYEFFLVRGDTSVIRTAKKNFTLSDDEDVIRNVLKNLPDSQMKNIMRNDFEKMVRDERSG